MGGNKIPLLSAVLVMFRYLLLHSSSERNLYTILVLGTCGTMVSPLFVCVCAYYTCLSAYVCVYVCMYVCMCVCMCVYVHACMRDACMMEGCVYVCMCERM